MQNNRCAEDMLTFAATKINDLPNLEFSLDAQNDHQVDFTPVLLVPEQSFLQSNTTLFQEFLKQLGAVDI